MNDYITSSSSTSVQMLHGYHVGLNNSMQHFDGSGPLNSNQFELSAQQPIIESACTHVTCKMIYDNDGFRQKYQGPKNIFVFVGSVQNVTSNHSNDRSANQEQCTSKTVSVELEDGTGSVSFTFKVDSKSTKLDVLVKQRYVRIMAKLMQSQTGRVTFWGCHVEPVTDFNLISFHQLMITKDHIANVHNRMMTVLQAERSFDSLKKEFPDINNDELHRALEHLASKGIIYEPCPGSFKLL